MMFTPKCFEKAWLCNVKADTECSGRALAPGTKQADDVIMVGNRMMCTRQCFERALALRKKQADDSTRVTAPGY